MKRLIGEMLFQMLIELSMRCLHLLIDWLNALP